MKKVLLKCDKLNENMKSNVIDFPPLAIFVHQIVMQSTVWTQQGVIIGYGQFDV